jgi:hypothetical protein
MIFRFLRSFLYDPDFAAVKNQIREMQSKIARYEGALESLQNRMDKTVPESDKVDPSFLGFLWALVAFVLALASIATENILSRFGEIINGIIRGRISIANLADMTWLILYFGAIAFVITNGRFGMRLLRRYTETKSDKGYRLFVKSISIFLAIYVIANLIFAIAVVLSIFIR